MTGSVSGPLAAVAEASARAVIAEHLLSHEDGKPALEALGRALGTEIDYGLGLRAFAEAVLAPYPQMSQIFGDLVEAKIELLTMYPLDYWETYSPSDITRMNEELGQLRSLRDRLAQQQA